MSFCRCCDVWSFLAAARTLWRVAQPLKWQFARELHVNSFLWEGCFSNAEVHWGFVCLF